MPTLRHDEIRDDLVAELSHAGRRQLEAFAAVYEARQVASSVASLRTEAGISQREAARRAGIDQADLSRIESAQITPSLPTLLRLLDAVGGSLVLARKTTTSGARATRKPVLGSAQKDAVLPSRAVATPQKAGPGVSQTGGRTAGTTKGESKKAAGRATTRRSAASTAPARAAIAAKDTTRRRVPA